MLFVTEVSERPLIAPDNLEQFSVVWDLAIDPEQLAADLAEYDPNSGTSPSVAVCRKYARVLFDAYLAAQQAGG